VRRPPRIGK